MNETNCSEGIVFVTPTLHGGGAERVAIELSSYFVSRGYEFTFLVTKCAEFDYLIPEGVEAIVLSERGDTGPIGQIRAIRRMMRG